MNGKFFGLLILVFISSLNIDFAIASERWEATSKTAYSITGNVIFNPSKIRFANGVTLKIQFVRAVSGLTWMPDNHNAPADLYQVKMHRDPVILGGNRICGNGPVTFFSVIRDSGTVYLSAYQGKTEPTGRSQICAGFDYTVR